MVTKGQPIGKGKPIGGKNDRRAGRGMLPPTGNGPVEVTPEWLREQQAGQSGAPLAPAGAAGAAPAATGAAPEAPAGAPGAAPATIAAPQLPDPDLSPADQLAVCERAIHAAKAKWQQAVEKATNEHLVDEAGPYLAWVHEHKLYRLMLDPAGAAYGNFERYLKEQHGLSKATGHRIVRAIPLLRILQAAGRVVPDLSVRQVRELHPVRLQHGHDAVVTVWDTACETKKGALPTPEELAKAKVLRGFATKGDDEEDRPEVTSGPKPGAAVARAAKILVPETVREAVKEDPDRVLLIMRVLRSALQEAGQPAE